MTTRAELTEELRAGRFARQASGFHALVTADGSSGFRAEPGRYHLYVSLACPWAHRTIIVRMLKGLEDVISLSVVDPIRDERGWAFRAGPGGETDSINGFAFLAEAYEATDPAFDMRVTVPVLWDRETGRIVNSESAEIIRMLNSEFDEWGNRDLDLYPAEHRDAIDALNERIYETVNNGVYRAGFATTQEAYDEAIGPLFETLADLDRRLADRRFLLGPEPTEADWRLFTTLVRFDVVYFGHFKCNMRRIVDHPHLWAYARDLYQQPGIAETVNFDHIRRHYYLTHRSLNPSGILPAGPLLDFAAPHDRGRLG